MFPLLMGRGKCKGHDDPRLKLKPGQKEPKRWSRSMGMPWCARYRYDEAARTRLKTVELIVERKELSPAGGTAAGDKQVPVGT